MEDNMSWLIEEIEMLFLPGISLRDICIQPDTTDYNCENELDSCVELEPKTKFVENSIVETDSESILDLTKNDDVKQFFISKEKWITKTNLLCWHCTNSFNGAPWFIPLQINKKLVTGDSGFCSEFSDYEILSSQDDIREIKIYVVFGNFCGPCCAKSYLEYSKDPELSNKWQCNELLKELFFIFYGIKIVEIPTAENPRRQRKFCGTIGITEQQYFEINEKKIQTYLKK